MKLDGLTMGVIGMAASAAVSLTSSPSVAQPQGAGGGSVTVQLQSPRDPGQGVAGAGLSISSTGTMVYRNGNDEVKLSTENGKVTSAELNGKAVPAERVKTSDGQITVEDESGKVVFQIGIAPAWGTNLGTWTVNGAPLRFYTGGPAVNGFGARGGLLGPGTGGGGQGILWGSAPDAEPPKVMMGVTMAEPEYGLRKHCGIEQRTGTMVNEVYKGLPAAKAGIEPYDVITEVDGKSPATPDVVRAVLREKGAGDKVEMTVLHKCQPKQVTVTLEAYNPEKLEQARQEQMKAAGIDPTDVFAYGQGEASDPLNQDFQKIIMKLRGGNGKAGQGTPFVVALPNLDGLPTEVQEQIKHTVKRAEEAQRCAEELSRQLSQQQQMMGGDAAKLMEDRLRHLEELMNKMIDQQQQQQPQAKPPAVTTKSSA